MKVILALVAGFFLWASLTSAETPTPLPDAPQPSTLQREADEIFKEVSRLRGLPIKSPVQALVKDRAFFRDHFRRHLLEQFPASRKKATEKAYALLGFLTEGADLIDTHLELLTAMVQGYYDPEAKALYIGDWVDPDKREGLLVHELTHALQDQYFDLGSFLEEGMGFSIDAQLARDSIMEGEAVAITLNYTLQDQGADFTRLKDIAQWSRQNRQLVESGQKAFGRKAVFNDAASFPYEQGAAFLQKYVRRYGWKGMNYLFEHPPSSTHQVLHPGSFFPRRRNPARVQVEDLSKTALGGGEKIWEDCFGEYRLYLLLRQYIGEGEARRAVEGWRGDQLQIYDCGGRPVLVGYLVFDGEDPAERFFEDYRALLKSKYSGAVPRRSDDTIHWAILEDEREVYVERFGKRAVFLEGTSSAQTSRVRSALWDVVKAKTP